MFVIVSHNNMAFHNSYPTDCILPAPPLNGETLLSSDNKELYYYCDKGYSLSTTNILRVCMDDGTGWSGDEPICCKYHGHNIIIYAH